MNNKQIVLFFYLIGLMILLQGCGTKRRANEAAQLPPAIQNSPKPPTKAPSKPAKPLPPVPKRIPPKPYPKGTHPVLVSDGYLIGGLKKGKIVELSLSDVTDILTYKCYKQQRFYKRLYARSLEGTDYADYVYLQTNPLGRGQKPKMLEYDTHNSQEEAKSDMAWDVALAADWDALPRKSQTGKLTDPYIVSAIKDQLVKHGIKQFHKPIGKVVIVDLDNDGKDEVVIEASSHDWKKEYPEGKTDYFSFILLLQQQSNEWHSSLIAGKFLPNVSDEISGNQVDLLQGVYDIDGDGWMEIVVYEFLICTDGYGFPVYKVKRSGDQLVVEAWLKGDE